MSPSPTAAPMKRGTSSHIMYMPCTWTGLYYCSLLHPKYRLRMMPKVSNNKAGPYVATTTSRYGGEDMNGTCSSTCVHRRPALNAVPLGITLVTWNRRLLPRTSRIRRHPALEMASLRMYDISYWRNRKLHPHVP
jgi:hypothetical protein